MTGALPPGGRTPARDLLATVDGLLDRQSQDTAGLWPRAATLLTRQALEVALKTFWSAQARGVEECSTTAQLLCLGRYIGDEDLAARAHHAWSALSRSCHHHPYDLAPTREEIAAWKQVVEDVVERTERAWMRRA